MGSSNHMTEAREIAQTAGIVMGLPPVTEERLKAAAVKLRELVAATADDDSDADLANKHFSAALERGKTAVERIPNGQRSP